LSISKKLSIIQGLIIALSLAGLTLFVSFTLDSSSKEYVIERLEKDISKIKSMFSLYNDALTIAVDKVLGSFDMMFEGEFSLDEEKKVSVNGKNVATLKINEKVINLNYDEVDKLLKSTGAVASVFVKNGNEFVRISTSAKTKAGKRAVGSAIGSSSAVYQKIMQKERYTGYVNLKGSDYIASYKPIVDGSNQVVAIIAVGLNVTQEFQSLKKEVLKVKIGKTGYVFALDTRKGLEGVTRIHPAREGVSLLSVKDDTGKYFIKEIVEKKEGIVTYPWVNKKLGEKKPREKMAVFTYFEPWKWVIASSSYTEEFLEANIKIRNYLIIISIFVTIAIVILIYLSIQLSVIKPIKELEDKAKNLSVGDGDLTQRLDESGGNEISEVSSSINLFIEKVQQIISNIKNISSNTQNIATELSKDSEIIQNSSRESSQMALKSVEDFEDVKNMLEDGSEKSTETKDKISKANDTLEVAKVDILNMVEMIKVSSSTEAELASRLNQLSNDAEQVKDVLTVIKDIADQTNLLALNAAIEAARAGEHGRGFAVVADNVRELAERTQKSLTEINTTISVIVQAIVDVSGRMSVNSESIEKLAEVSIEVESKINDTSSLMQESAISAQNSLDSTLSVVSNSKSRIDNVEKISSLSDANYQKVENITSSIDDLYTLINDLNSKINDFKV